MTYLKSLVVVLAVTAVSLAGAASADAQGRRAGGGAAGRAVPRAGGAPGARVARPAIGNPRGFGGNRGFRGVPYRPYYYPSYPYSYFPYGPGLTIGLGLGYPYDYVYPYSGYGYYGAYGYGYPYGSAGYVSAFPGAAYGGVRIEGAPRNAQVFTDGYYVGIVDDFDGVFQHVDLTPGAHRIEIRAPGAPPTTFDVRVQPGQTITYHADLPRK